MKRPFVVLGLVMCFGLAASPAAAQCGVDTVCASFPAGSTPSDIVEELEDNWHLPDFACNINATNSGQIDIIASNGTRTIEFFVPAGTTGLTHSYNLRIQLPLGASSSTVFDMFLEYDGAPEILLRDGTLDLGEITQEVHTFPDFSGGIPMVDPKRAALIVLGLLAAGVAYIVLRRA